MVIKSYDPTLITSNWTSVQLQCLFRTTRGKQNVKVHTNTAQCDWSDGQMMWGHKNVLIHISYSEYHKIISHWNGWHSQHVTMLSNGNTESSLLCYCWSLNETLIEKFCFSSKCNKRSRKLTLLSWFHVYFHDCQRFASKIERAKKVWTSFVLYWLSLLHNLKGISSLCGLDGKTHLELALYCYFSCSYILTSLFICFSFMSENIILSIYHLSEKSEHK